TYLIGLYKFSARSLLRRRTGAVVIKSSHVDKTVDPRKAKVQTRVNVEHNTLLAVAQLHWDAYGRSDAYGYKMSLDDGFHLAPVLFIKQALSDYIVNENISMFIDRELELINSVFEGRRT